MLEEDLLSNIINLQLGTSILFLRYMDAAGFVPQHGISLL